jgi:Leucine-rich repeat (LRR) protein
MQALETLVLRRNAISHIPAELSACVALINLDISENQILALPAVLLLSHLHCSCA